MSAAIADIVVVSFNSARQLRSCVEHLATAHDMHVVIVDNASMDGSLAAVSDLPVTRLPQSHNGGFAKGCNIGWKHGGAPYVLLLNPDARIDADSVRALAKTLDEHPGCGAVAPRIEQPDGSYDYSQRRFETVRQVFAEACFLHRIVPMRAWTDGTIRDPSAYASTGTPEWVSGACVLIRRSLLAQLGGLDERFFLYCEDMDLCRRIWDAGYEVRYEPSAIAVHEGGASSSDAVTIPMLAASRLQYARKHFGVTRRALHRVGLGLAATTRILISHGGMPVSAAHARSLRMIVSV
jgi:N-acetylglucosaminyl-diphospho-decaprenol L-rhamnosyltransferase